MARPKKSVEKPKTKKTTAKTPRIRTKKTTTGFDFQRYFSQFRGGVEKNRKLITRYLIILLIIVLVGGFVYLKKDWFVAAVVNNQPITTLELYQNLKSKDGQTVLDQLIRDKLIVQEANKRGISISQDEINKRVDQVTKQVGGKQALQSALEQQGFSQDEFQNQIKVQLMVEKILGNEIEVSDKEVSDYIAKNPAETQGVSKDDVKSQLRSNKLNQKFQAWYADLQKKSKIIKFI